MNMLVHGLSAPDTYAACKASVGGLPEARISDSDWLAISPLHHEFMVAQCAHHGELLDALLEVALFRRIDGQRHPVMVVGVHLLSPCNMIRLKSIVSRMSDRTRFLMTTASCSRLPRTLLNCCTLLRVKLDSTAALDALPCMAKVIQFVHNALRSDLGAQKKLATFRELAYAMMTSGVSMGVFGMQLVAALAHECSDPARFVSIVAEAEARSRQLKKDVLAWEAMMLDLSDPGLWALKPT